jgi:hypothetical protein
MVPAVVVAGLARLGLLVVVEEEWVFTAKGQAALAASDNIKAVTIEDKVVLVGYLQQISRWPKQQCR